MRWLLLDLAGVVADFDSDARLGRLAERTGLSVPDVRDRLYGSGFVARADDGQLDADQVLAGLRDCLDWPGSDAELAGAWASAFTAVPAAQEAVAGFRRRHPRVRTALLTNNDALLDRVLPGRLPGVFDLLDAGAHFAGTTGFAKPDPRAWTTVLAQWHADPSEVLFLDDSDGHVAAARELGLAAVHVPGPDGLAAALAASSG